MHMHQEVYHKVKRNAQIEKELMAFVFAAEKFHQFVYGREVDVHTDHKPLEAITRKDIDKVSARMQRMLIKLLRYRLNVQYVPGNQLKIADP